MRRSSVVGLALISVLGSAVVAFAEAPRTWSISTGRALAEGKLESTAVDPEGHVRLAPKAGATWGPEPGIVWDLSVLDGPVYMGLSSPGRLLEVSGSGEARVRLELSGERMVTAVAAVPGGGVFGAVSPGAELFHGAANRQASPVATIEATFVWALAARADGSVAIGTGVPGGLFEYRPGRGIRLVLETGVDPVRTVLPLPDGGWVIGTGAEGRVLRVASDGKAYVLFDSSETEVVALEAFGDGELLALTANAARQLAPVPTPVASVGSSTTTVTATAPPTSANGAKPVAPPAPPPKPRFVTPPGGSLYRIDPEGGAEAIWSSTRDLPFGMAVDGEGQLIVATGNAGKLYRIDRSRRLHSILARIGSEQASAIARDAEGTLWVGGTTDATLERFAVEPAAYGRYFSPVVDSGHAAQWGRLRWHAEVPRGAKLRMLARVGNSAEPDKTWTDFVVLEGDGVSGARAELPRSRYFQAIGEFQPSRSGASPRLSSLELRYDPLNRPPRIRSFDLAPSGVVWSANPTPQSQRTRPLVADDPVARRGEIGETAPQRPVAVRKSFEQGARTASWKAEDPDGDPLEFDLDIRREGETHWIPLAHSLRAPFHGWDTRGLPDGTYRLRLTVRDGLDRSADEQGTDVRVGSRFLVDNSRPSLVEPRIQRAESGYALRFEARDEGGQVASVEFSVDAGPWEPVEPMDGVADSAEEVYQLVIPEGSGEPGELPSVRIRVADSAGNLSGDAFVLDEGD